MGFVVELKLLLSRRLNSLWTAAAPVSGAGPEFSRAGSLAHKSEKQKVESKRAEAAPGQQASQELLEVRKTERNPRIHSRPGTPESCASPFLV
jgi:hypothetical protein